MKKATLFSSCLLLLSASIGFNSCTKSNSINNGQVIQTPYTLYFTDSAGALYNTNDGKNLKVMFPPDGSTSLSLVTVKDKILIAKAGSDVTSSSNLFVSADGGKNFNYSYTSTDLATYPGVACNGKPFNLNQSMLIYMTPWDHEYVASRTSSGLNYFGMASNVLDGALLHWDPEAYYDTDQISNTAGTKITSFTMLKNETLIAYNALARTTLYRPTLNTRWKGLALPTLPGAPSFFSIGHLNNRIIAIDNYGTNGAWYSDDLGSNWYSYAGLPANTPLLCVSSPFEQVCLVGTDGNGIYILNPNNSEFQPSNAGLPSGAVVRNIAFKENVFKNGVKQQYVYIATNKGIYQSSDMGNNWVKTVSGNFICVY